MAKKSKQERRQIRKEGWQQAGRALKGMYVDTAKTLGQGALSGAKAGIDSQYAKGTRSTLPAANLTGGLLSGLGGATKGFVKSIPTTAKQYAKANWEFIKGVFKGIFNHPEWWKYRNVLSIPAYNANRPFDPVAIKSIMGSYKTAPGIGVTHIVKQNVIFSDMRNEKSFQLAMIEAFKEIRLDLKSNLPYTQEQYNDFIQYAMAIMAKAKAYERLLGWYNVTRADIPELQPAVLSVPQSTQEWGKVSPINIEAVSGSNYADTLNKYRQLQSIVANIAIPEKLADFISWWLASVFVDQNAPNAQLYFNELRECPTYSYNTNGVLTQTGLWDIANGSIDTVIAEAIDLLNTCGIMNADIIKTGKYGRIILADVDKDKYTPILLCDPEFFTILINSYTVNRNEGGYSNTINPEYVRVDVLEDLNEANLVGVTNALSTWAGVNVPFRIVSQAAYFTADTTINSPRNVNITASLAADVGYDAFVASTGNFWYQYSGLLADTVMTRVYAASTSVQYQYNFNTKYNGTGVGTISAGSIRLVNTDDNNGIPSLYCVVSDTFTGTITRTFAQAGSTYFNVSVGFAGGVLSSVTLSKSTTKYRGTSGSGFEFYQADGIGINATVTTIATLTSGTNYVSATGTIIPNKKFVAIGFKQSLVTVGSSYYNDVLSVFTIGSDFFNTNVVDEYDVTTTTTAVTGVAKYNNISAITNITDYIDYHLPIILRQNVSVGDGNHTLRSYGIHTLRKATYIPLIFNYSDVDAVLYWMYLGLFSTVQK